MPDDDAFEIAFTWPEEGAEHDADAAEWLERFARHLARADQVRIEITGSYHRNPPDPQDPDPPEDDGDGDGDGDGDSDTDSDADSDGGGSVPVIYVKVCPGKRA